MENEQLSSSLEDYLEAILHLQEQRSVARAKEIGQQLHVRQSSVTTALQSLAKRGLVNYAPYDFITLTEAGRKVAEDVAQRHEVMRQFLLQVLRVDEPEASEVACKLEHALSGLVLERFVSFMEFVNRCPEGLAEWSPESGFYCSRHGSQSNCTRCELAPPKTVRKRTRLKVGS